MGRLIGQKLTFAKSNVLEYLGRMVKEKKITEAKDPEEVEEFFEKNQNPHLFHALDISALGKSEKHRTLESLFNEVINTRGIHHDLGMDESTVRAIRKRHNDGRPVSVEKMREVLKAKGYKCVQEERWG